MDRNVTVWSYASVESKQIKSKRINETRFLLLCNIHNVEEYGNMNVKLHVFQISVPDGYER